MSPTFQTPRRRTGTATRLEKGRFILSHAVFRAMVKIKFPMAAYKQPS
jgi:hypothetical protein